MCTMLSTLRLSPTHARQDASSTELIDDRSRGIQGGIAKAFLDSRVSCCGRPESARRSRTRQIRPIEKLNIEIYSRQNRARVSKLSFITQLYVTRYEARLSLYVFHSFATLIDY